MSSRPTLLRVKRRRDEAAPYEIVVEGGGRGDAKRARVDELTKALSTKASLAVDNADLPTPAAGADSPAPAPLRFRHLGSVAASGGAGAGEVAVASVRELMAARGGPKNLSGGKASVAVAARTRADGARSSAARAARAADVRMRVGGRGGDGDDGGVDEVDVNLRAMFHIYDLMNGAAGVGSGDRGTSAPTAAPAASTAGTLPLTPALVRRRAGLRAPAGAAYRARFMPLHVPTPARILRPAERAMDAAIWTAFQRAEFNGVFEALALGADVNFQRCQSDLTTALMAAAYHGAARVAAGLLRRDALVRVPNLHGATAAALAAERGHTDLARFLRDVLAEEQEEVAAWFGVGGPAPEGASASTDDAGECYDLYVEVGGDDGENMDGNAGRKARVAVESELYDELVTFVRGEASGEAAARRSGMQDEGEVPSDSEWLEAAERDSLPDSDADSQDSNAEGATGNDYPEDEASDSGSGAGIGSGSDSDAPKTERRNAGTSGDGDGSSEDDVDEGGAGGSRSGGAYSRSLAADLAWLRETNAEDETMVSTASDEHARRFLAEAGPGAVAAAGAAAAAAAASRRVTFAGTTAPAPPQPRASRFGVEIIAPAADGSGLSASQLRLPAGHPARDAAADPNEVAEYLSFLSEHRARLAAADRAQKPASS